MVVELVIPLRTMD